MKRLLVAGLVAVACATHALAEELPTKRVLTLAAATRVAAAAQAEAERRAKPVVIAVG